MLAGSLAPDAAPCGDGPCLLCLGPCGNSGDNVGAVGEVGASGESHWFQASDLGADLAQHMAHARHRQARQRARKLYHCYWQELFAPDARPYYYDHVTHTWTFAMPKRLMVPADSTGGAPVTEQLEFKDKEKNDVKARLARALLFPSFALYGGSTGSTAAPAIPEERLVIVAPSPVVYGAPEPATVGSVNGGCANGGANGWYGTSAAEGAKGYYKGKVECPHCFRAFTDSWSMEQHAYAMSGRNGHPEFPHASYALATQESASAAGAAMSPWGGSAMLAPDPPLAPDHDVEKAGDEANPYWYNPRTRASAWSRDALCGLNREFYAGITMALADTDDPTALYWIRPPDLAAWTLEDLHTKYAELQGTSPT